MAELKTTEEFTRELVAEAHPKILESHKDDNRLKALYQRLEDTLADSSVDTGQQVREIVDRCLGVATLTGMMEGLHLSSQVVVATLDHEVKGPEEGEVSNSEAWIQVWDSLLGVNPGPESLRDSGWAPFS